MERLYEQKSGSLFLNHRFFTFSQERKSIKFAKKKKTLTKPPQAAATQNTKKMI